MRAAIRTRETSSKGTAKFPEKSLPRAAVEGLGEDAAKSEPWAEM